MLPIARLNETDIKNIPNPLPATIIISTNSRFFLKYCAIIMVEQSRDMPTPKPTIIPAIKKMLLQLLNGFANDQHWTGRVCTVTKK